MNQCKEVASPGQWRSLLRSLLRESSYLPDPIARSACHDHILRRFRKPYEDKRPGIKDDVYRMNKLRQNARKSLSILQRANEGYPKPLERVLKFAYGRIGKRRAELLQDLLKAHSAPDSEAVSALIEESKRFGEGWEPPQVLVDLMKSQSKNPTVSQLYDRKLVRSSKPQVDGKTAWDKPLPSSRRKNIRRRWYKAVAQALLPPLPDAELKILEGLLSGNIPWSPPRRRPKPHSTLADAENVTTKGEMLRKVLTDGPPKDGTFRPYQDGRPHKITRRFMSRVWRRISSLVPRHRWDAEKGKHCFEWEYLPSPQLALSAKEQSAPEIFTGLDKPTKPAE